MNRMMVGEENRAWENEARPARLAARSPQRVALAHCLLAPMHYEPSYAYPLLVWLHGPGDDERQLHRVMPHISLRNYVAIAPRGTSVDQVCESGAKSYLWRQSPDDIMQSVDRILECVELAGSRCHVARERVFLAGYDAGGTMALRIALSCPDLFAGAASFGGPFPRNHTPLCNVMEARRIPLLLACGADSHDYPEARVCDDIRLMHAAGIGSLNVRQYPCGDELVTQMLKDFNCWMMQLVTGQPLEESAVPRRGPSELN